jgi:hypothetical protein
MTEIVSLCIRSTSHHVTEHPLGRFEVAGWKRISRHLSGSVPFFEAQALTVIAASRIRL